MKILFLTEGGRGIGYGHISRCLAIAQAVIQRDSAVRIEFLINGDGGVPNSLGGVEIKRLAFDWSMESERAYALAANSDAVIIDSYLADSSFYEVLPRKISGNLLIIDDNKRLDYASGIVLSPSVYGNELAYPENKAISYLKGKDYIILGREFWDVPSKKINKEIKNVLVTLGGSDMHSVFLDELVDFFKGKFDFIFNVVDVRRQRINAATMINFMLMADLCIIGGGHTTNEVLRVGCPAIGICFAENQLRNLEWLHRAQCLEYVGWYTDARIKENIAAGIMKLSAHKIRKDRAALGKTIVDGQGALRIADALLKTRNEKQ